MSEQDPFAVAEGEGDAFALRDDEEIRAAAEAEVHRLRSGHVCNTERRGYATPRNRSPLELVLEASEGFIPLWERDVTLRWRFQERSLVRFRNPEAAKAAVRRLMLEAVLAWGDAIPVRFSEQAEAWDFEIAVRDANQCNPAGCTLASAFFPDQGQHELAVYPMLFTMSPAEQVETMAHEIGHIFGLRHFFAQTREREWAVELFGAHEERSIMNYGDLSQLTDTDRRDLKRLYELVWAGALTNINGTPIRTVRPFSALRP
jgi:hypothetical protein